MVDANRHWHKNDNHSKLHLLKVSYGIAIAEKQASANDFQ